MRSQITLQLDSVDDVVPHLASHLSGTTTGIFVGQASSNFPEIERLVATFCAALPLASVIPITGSVPRIDDRQEIPHFDQIIAIGGGKVIDSAKIASLGLTKTELLEQLAQGNTALPRKSRLICIPTTAGSGSEATHFAVCYLGTEKVSIADNSILPDFAVLCSELLVSLSKRQLSISGLDVTTQAIESLFSKGATIESEANAREALFMILPVMRSLSTTHPDIKALQEMQTAANLAGRAINKAKTNLPHALSYHLTIRAGVPHGLAVALFFESYLRLLDSQRENSPTDADQRKLEFVFRTLCGTERYQQHTWTSLLSSLSLPTIPADLERSVSQTGLLTSVNVERLRNFAFPFNLETFVSQALSLCQVK